MALALPATSPELIAAVTEGFLLGGYSFTEYKSSASPDAVAEIVVLSPIARRKDAVAAFAETQVVTRAVATTRDWVNMPPGDFTPPAFADAVVEAGKAHARGKHKVSIKVLDEQAARGARLRRDARRGPRLVGTAAAGRAHLLPQGAPSSTSRWSARASRSTPAG